MRIDVFFTAQEADEPALEGRVTAVVDVIRATSCIVEGLANGARGIFPTGSMEEAIKLASSLGREDTLLCGERKGLRIDGFDLGNSPREFTRDAVEGKQLVMTTTNGTQAFLAATTAEKVFAASFLNLSSVAEALAEASEAVILCAGRQGRFSLEDALCAGFLLRQVTEGGQVDLRLNDAGIVAQELARHHEATATFLRTTAAGRALKEIDLLEDLDLCVQVDRHPILPLMTDRRIALGRDRG